MRKRIVVPPRANLVIPGVEKPSRIQGLDVPIREKRIPSSLVAAANGLAGAGNIEDKRGVRDSQRNIAEPEHQAAARGAQVLIAVRNDGIREHKRLTWVFDGSLWQKPNDDFWIRRRFKNLATQTEALADA
jgi:hypothetical protein